MDGRYWDVGKFPAGGFECVTPETCGCESERLSGNPLLADSLIRSPGFLDWARFVVVRAKRAIR